MITTNNRVDLSICCKGCEIDCILGQGVEALFGISRVHPTVSADLVDGGFEGGFGETGLFNDGLNTGILDESEEEMVLSDVGVVHGLLDGLGLPDEGRGSCIQGDLLWWRRLRGQPDDDTVESPPEYGLTRNISVGVITGMKE